MDSEAGLPQLYYPQDPLRAGLTHLKDFATPNHPLEHALKQVRSALLPRCVRDNCMSSTRIYLAVSPILLCSVPGCRMRFEEAL